MRNDPSKLQAGEAAQTAIQDPEFDLPTGRIRATVDLAVTATELFAALTDPREFERWWGSEDTYHMTRWIQDFRETGSYTVQVRNQDGRIHPASGVFIRIDPPNKIVYTRKYDWDFPGLGRNVTRITYEINQRSNGVRLIVLHEGFEGFAEAGYEHAAGWKRVLNWLQSYLSRSKAPDYHFRFSAAITPREAMEGISNISGWWAHQVEGLASHLNDVFIVRFGKTYSRMKIVEFVADRRMVWLVEDCHLDLLKDRKEWKNTRIVWEIATKGDFTMIEMTHLGLTPAKECFLDCSGGWDFYVGNSLFNFLTRQIGRPGTGIMATIRAGERMYKGTLFSKDQPLTDFPPGWLLIDVRETKVERITGAYSIRVLNQDHFNRLQGLYYMVIENKPVQGDILPMEDLQELINTNSVD